MKSIIQQHIQTMIRNTVRIALVACFFNSYSPQANALEVEVSGEGRPLLFIPGLACNGEVWNEAVAALKEDYACHVFSLPGFAGTSPMPFEGAYLATIKDLIKSYIRENALKEPILIGHSLGGMLGMWIACDADSPLAGLIIVDSLPFLSAVMNPNATEADAKAMATAMRSSAAESSPEQMRMMMQQMITDPERVEQALEWSRLSDANTVGQAMFELYTTDLRNDIAKITIPTLVLGAWVAYKDYGATRESTQAIFAQQFRKLPNHQIVMSDKGRHFIQWDDPDFFLHEVKNYLQSIPHGSGN